MRTRPARLLSSSKMNDDSGGPRRGAATVDHRLPDGRTIAVPLSMGAADDARLATVMLTRDDHRQPLRKERIAEAISGALCDLSVNTDVVAVQKYHKDKNIICKSNTAQTRTLMSSSHEFVRIQLELEE